MQLHRLPKAPPKLYMDRAKVQCKQASIIKIIRGMKMAHILSWVLASTCVAETRTNLESVGVPTMLKMLIQFNYFKPELCHHFGHRCSCLCTKRKRCIWWSSKVLCENFKINFSFSISIINEEKFQVIKLNKSKGGDRRRVSAYACVCCFLLSQSNMTCAAATRLSN